jgi:hypothetical protein
MHTLRHALKSSFAQITVRGGLGVRGEIKEEFERSMGTKGPWCTIATQVFAPEEDVVLAVPPNF